ncbi:hypothetical protein [Pseudomonas syringae]|uniref:hypothetical protein n=1 Tax=Pseudomonas syringae TaxID=317 RepID=UPI001F23B8B1|nr:hypothetical protein [Pseudomonas syringae]MCF5724982.1 hypothetical protein [Pseudomonas syringae]
MHAIDSSNTCWVFVSDSTEARHSYDVIHAISVLRDKGVSNNAIRFFTDDPQAIQYTTAYNCPNPISISNFDPELAALTGFDYLFITFTGHGGIQGVGHPVKISSHSLVTAARSPAKLKLVVIALTQCFAGTFNYIDARTEPRIIMFGAANLSTSLSTPMSVGLPIQGQAPGLSLKKWSANSFMLYLFRWILNPKDIDGDGQMTLLDAYKYSGSSASGAIIDVKPAIFMQAQMYAEQSRQLAIGIQNGVIPDDAQAKLLAATLRTELSQQVSLLHASQEPWLLHADLARQLVMF